MSKAESPPRESASLDSDCDNRTRWEKRLSGPETADLDSGDSEEPENWGRQQKRVFHRVNTLLHYWESREYEILWVTLTSCPESDPAGELAYNVRRLRQRIERARAARDGDGDFHRLTHLVELEQLAIRTSEGPAGKGVVHLFWAWKPHEGQHGRDFYIPQKWLAEQWADIHGPEQGPEVWCQIAARREQIENDRLYVWVEKYGEADYHDRSSVARYCVTQYLGEHAEALEHVSWSHGRTLGGSLVEAWKAVRGHAESLSEAVDRWERVVAGEAVKLGSNSENVDYGIRVEPPPDLGVTELEGVSVTPSESYETPGPHQNTVRTVVTQTVECDWKSPDHSPDMVEELVPPEVCPECREYHTLEVDGRIVRCTSEFCGSRFGVDERVVMEREFRAGDWDFSVETHYRQTTFREFGGTDE